jgi:DnaK suppressor protein
VAEVTTVDDGHAVHDGERAQLRDRLREERDRAAVRAATLERELRDIIESADTANIDDEHDPEGSTIAFERAQLTEVLRVTRAELADLDAAVERLEHGSFGRCERCDRPIPVERLLARPASRRCVTCADLTST